MIHKSITGIHFKAERFCDSLAKIRVWLGHHTKAAGVKRISEKGKDSQNESTCSRFSLPWWNFPAFGGPEYTSRVLQRDEGWGKTKQNKQKTTNNPNSSKDETCCKASEGEIADSQWKPWKRKWFPFKFWKLCEVMTASCRLAFSWSDFIGTHSAPRPSSQPM